MLLRAWLMEETKGLVQPWEAPPCGEQLVCGTVRPGDLSRITEAVHNASAGGFYRSRQAAIDAFARELQRPTRRQVLLAQLLATGQAVSGDLEKLPAQITFPDLERIWRRARENGLWTSASPIEPGGATDSKPPDARSSPSQTSRSPGPSGEEANETQDLAILVDRDSAISSVLVLWALPPRADVGLAKELLPEVSSREVHVELFGATGGTFIGLRLTSDSTEELLAATQKLLSETSLQTETVRPDGPRREADPPEGSPGSHSLAGALRPTSLDRRCDAAWVHGNGTLRSPPGVVASGFSEVDEPRLWKSLSGLPQVRLLLAKGGSVQPFVEPKPAPSREDP
jgi:hypothetical protein